MTPTHVTGIFVVFLGCCQSALCVPLVLSDFEDGISGWEASAQSKGAQPSLAVVPEQESKIGYGALQVTFPAVPGAQTLAYPVNGEALKNSLASTRVWLNSVKGI